MLHVQLDFQNKTSYNKLSVCVCVLSLPSTILSLLTVLLTGEGNIKVWDV